MSLHDDTARFARKLVAIRAQRNERFGPALFDEYGWELLLVLFLADADGRRLTGRDAIAQSRASEMVGKRWLDYLRQRGFVLGDEALTAPVTLSGATLDRIERFLADAMTALAD